MKKIVLGLALAIFLAFSGAASADVLFGLFEGDMATGISGDNEIFVMPDSFFDIFLELNATPPTGVGGIGADIEADAPGIFTIIARDIDQTMWFENDGLFDNSAPTPIPLIPANPSPLEALMTIHNPPLVEELGIMRPADFTLHVDAAAAPGDYLLFLNYYDASDWMGVPHDPLLLHAGEPFIVHVVVPEPGAFALLGMGIAVAVYVRRKKS
ncbi:MAG TPA: PEP-CTERM sorting domain-containing protein [Candidatus Brocadiia bacterium]|nr:PEP-CTERM sorting domain-containing protein [Candidatus Brocadiia bacterium]